MKKILDQVAVSVKEATEKTSQAISDGLEHENTQIALDWTKKAANTAAEEAARFGKEVVQSDMFKGAATGATVGALIGAISPIPFVGSALVGTLGAGVGLVSNLMRPSGGKNERRFTEQRAENLLTQQVDVYDQLTKFDELRQKGIITSDEFEAKKRELLKNA